MLHERLRRERDKVFAHSDGDMMRMRVSSGVMDINGTPMTLFNPVFDNGLSFIGVEVFKVLDLISVLYHAVWRQLHEDAQCNPHLYNFSKDYL
ncbi:MAG: hypothetical protein RLZ26_2345 [Pseudomonadota bacterium]